MISLIVVSAALAYADCVVSYYPNCSGPPINQYDQGIAYDTCGSSETMDFWVTSVPTKSFAHWKPENGLDGYTIYTTQCSINEGYHQVFTPCNGGTWENLQFTVYGSIEDAAYPSGNNCYNGG